MGVSIMYRPIKNNGKDVDFGHRSDCLAALEKVFGIPIRIKDSDAGKLRAMSDATGEEGYRDLANKAVSYGEIEVWGEY